MLSLLYTQDALGFVKSPGCSGAGGQRGNLGHTEGSLVAGLLVCSSTPGCPPLQRSWLIQEYYIYIYIYIYPRSFTAYRVKSSKHRLLDLKLPLGTFLKSLGELSASVPSSLRGLGFCV